MISRKATQYTQKENETISRKYIKYNKFLSTVWENELVDQIL